MSDEQVDVRKLNKWERRRVRQNLMEHIRKLNRANVRGQIEPRVLIDRTIAGGHITAKRTE